MTLEKLKEKYGNIKSALNYFNELGGVKRFVVLLLEVDD